MKGYKDKKTGLISTSDLKTVKGKMVYWMFFAILCICSIIALVPAIWTIMTAFKDTQEIYSSFTFFPSDLSWNRVVARISESWSELQLGDSIVNTFILSVGDLFFRLVVCGFGGYTLSKLKPKGTKLIFTLVVWTMMMPSQIRMVPNYMGYMHFPFAFDIGGVNLLDTYWPLWLEAGADTFAVLLFKNNFDAISTSYVESAKLDGCGNFGVFFKIMLPLSLPIVMYEAINVLTMSWSSFFKPLLVLDENVVLPLKIYRLKNDASIQMNTYFMGLIFASIPPFLIFSTLQKYIIGGINVGGVKG